MSDFSQLELFGRVRPDASAKHVDWDGVSGHDLATDARLFRRYQKEQAPRDRAQMQRWARSIAKRRRAAWAAERKHETEVVS